MIRSNKGEYWRERASRYSGFKWANDHEYKWTFISACDLKKSDWVLDAGCGPGIISQAICPMVDRVIGMDNSKEMLSQCDGTFNLMFGDCRDIPFPDNTFDKVLVRNVFHHMTGELKSGVRECYRVLKPGGRIIIGERVPPSDSRKVYVEYREMLALKDDRQTFSEDRLKWMTEQVGFKYYTSFEFWIKGFNVREWLESSGLDYGVQMEIWDRHINGSEEFKEASRMRFTDEAICEKKGIVHCHIDTKNIIMVGVKE